MKSYEFIAKTVDKAIKLGLETLGKNQEDVDIQIVNEGGFLKKAKVIIKVEEETIKTFVQKKEETKPEPKVEPKPEPKKEEPKVPTKEEKNIEEKVEKQQVVSEANDIKPEVEMKEILADEKVEEPKKEKKVEQKEKSKKQFDYVVPTQEELEEKRRVFAETHFENNQTSVEFVKGLLEVLKIDGQVTLEEKKDNSYIVIETENAGRIIGYKGDSIAGIQYLANIIESNNNPNAKRVVIDSGNYKQKREDSLRALAIKVAGRVSETGRTQKLEPMDAYERRIVHTELQNYPSVETHSEGVEPFRHIVVTKKRK